MDRLIGDNRLNNSAELALIFHHEAIYMGPSKHLRGMTPEVLWSITASFMLYVVDKYARDFYICSHTEHVEALFNKVIIIMTYRIHSQCEIDNSKSRQESYLLLTIVIYYSRSS